MKTHFDVLIGDMVRHAHDPEDITGLADLMKGFQGAIDASAGGSGNPISPPVITVSGWWLITKGGYILFNSVPNLFEAGDMLIYTHSSGLYSRVDAKTNDAQVDITSVFTKLLSGLVTQKAVNEHLDKLVTTSASAPSVTNDSSSGYFAGSFWLRSAGEIYQCLDASVGAAQWLLVGTSGLYNDIGTAGEIGFGVGICGPGSLPTGLVPISGTFDKTHANYGNYQVAVDGSEMVFVPRHWMRIGDNRSSLYALFGSNAVDVAKLSTFASEAEANALGYFLPRCFIDGGQVQPGYFVDKYNGWSLTNSDGDVNNPPTRGIASSKKYGNPMSSDSAGRQTPTNPTYPGDFSNARSNGQSPAYYAIGMFACAKSRGNNFAPTSLFIERNLFFLALAQHEALYAKVNGGTITQGQAQSIAAWYLTSGVSAPRGNNNYGVDNDDATISFVKPTDGFWAVKSPTEACQTGSAKKGGLDAMEYCTHNGQKSGVQVNGNQWLFTQGFTTITEGGQNAVSITRAAECVVTIPNASASNANYANGKRVWFEGSNTSEWNGFFQYKFYIISDLTGNTFKLKDKNGAYINTSALSADFDTAGGNFTVRTGKFYVLKESVALKNMLGAAGTGNANNYFENPQNFDEVDPIAFIGGYVQVLGNGSNRVFSGSTDRTSEAYKLRSCGIPVDGNAVGGTNLMGQDYFLIWLVNQCVPLSGGYWGGGSSAGAGAAGFGCSSGGNGRLISARSCLYLVG
ncbi:MAG: hypothetical protein NTU51_10650 [Bacteroidetes bacterium]|nr:hypothetical protein [Bacteroidota bacterium]